LLFSRPAYGLDAAFTKPAYICRGACELPFRQSLKHRQAIRDVMEVLLVGRENRRLRAAKKTRIVKRAAFSTKLARYGALKIAAGKLFGRCATKTLDHQTIKKNFPMV
jgi:hypothetical protein